jgi:hypothetical protein
MSLNAPKLPDLTRKGDIAIFGLGYGGGFALDIFLFGANSSPPPLTVALVVAIVCLAIKYGYEATQEEPPAEESPLAEQQQRQDQLRARLNGLERTLLHGAYFTDSRGVVIAAVLDFSSEVLFENRWEPNPNYDPQTVEYTEQLPYIRHEQRGNLVERYMVLRVLWESGTITDQYAEARLDELSDIVYQQVETTGWYEPEPEQLEEQGIVQRSPEDPSSSS